MKMVSCSIGKALRVNILVAPPCKGLQMHVVPGCIFWEWSILCFSQSRVSFACVQQCGLQFSEFASEYCIIKIATEQKAAIPKATLNTWNRRQRWVISLRVSRTPDVLLPQPSPEEIHRMSQHGESVGTHAHTMPQADPAPGQAWQPGRAPPLVLCQTLFLVLTQCLGFVASDT